MGCVFIHRARSGMPRMRMGTTERMRRCRAVNGDDMVTYRAREDDRCGSRSPTESGHLFFPQLHEHARAQRVIWWTSARIGGEVLEFGVRVLDPAERTQRA